MLLQGVGFSVPSRRVTNDDVLQRLESSVAGLSKGDRTRIQRTIARLLIDSGAESRYWLDQGQSPIEGIQLAVSKALRNAGVLVEDVDLIIYAGVSRGFLEPGDSYFIADAVGARNASCFDVLDACNAWMRAAIIAQSLLDANEYRSVLVVNGEYPMSGSQDFARKLFEIRNPEQIAYRFAGLTLGEGATAALFTKGGSRWTLRERTRADLACLCQIPLPGYAGRTTSSWGDNPPGELEFRSYGSAMFEEATMHMLDLLNQQPEEVHRASLIVPHSASHSAYATHAQQLGIDHKLIYVYPTYGNLAAASIPAALALALDADRLRRGDSVFVWAASAGMTFSACSFAY